jgi:class 3 adenylate cyclase
MFFSDVAGFVALSSRMDEGRVSDLLNRLYSQFDDLAHYHGVHKLETIGDAYLAATNLSGDQVSFLHNQNQNL